MRRLMVAGATLALLGAGLFIPAHAKVATSPADALTAGTVTIVVGGGGSTWTTTVSGQFAAGGRTYAGTASGAANQFPGSGAPYRAPMSFAGTSSTGSIAATCTGAFVSVAGLPIVNEGANPTGLLQEHCDVSIDGAPNVPLGLVLAVAPTTDATAFSGVYAGLPDAAGLQNLPLSFGAANAETTARFAQTVSFSFTGQLAFGGQVFHGVASGGTGVPGIGNVMEVPTFTLAGASSTGTVNATCSGVFASINPVSQFVGAGFYPIGAALSVLTCNGSVNGGPPASAIFVSAYGATAEQLCCLENDYGGIFVGA